MIVPFTTAPAVADAGDAVDCELEPEHADCVEETPASANPIEATTTIQKLFEAGGIGGKVTQILSIVGVVAAVFLIGKTILSTLQMGAGLATAAMPIMLYLVAAGVAFNLDDVMTLVGKLIGGMGSTVTAFLNLIA